MTDTAPKCVMLWLAIFLLTPGITAVSSARKEITIGKKSLFCFHDLELFFLHENKIGVALDESDVLIRTAIEKGLASISLPDTKVRIQEVILDKNASECDVCQKLLLEPAGPRINVLIDTTDNDWMQAFTRKAGIPTISTAFGLSETERVWPGLTDQAREWLIQINPPEDTMCTIVSDLVNEYGIRNAVLLFDMSFGQSPTSDQKSLMFFFSQVNRGTSCREMRSTTRHSVSRRRRSMTRNH